MGRTIVLALVLIFGFSFAGDYFDVNRLKGGHVDKAGIRKFGNAQKSGVLSSPENVKSTAEKLGYDESKLNGDINQITDEKTKNRILDFMSKFQNNSTKWKYRCREKRIVKIKQLWQCSLNKDVFDDYNLCDTKCLKQYECNQAKCYQTLQCERLSAGYICPIQKTQCQASISCPQGGTYNANTGKCEAQPL